MEEDLDTKLAEWVAFLEANGIKQQTEDWHIARQCTIGGSSMATIQGINPYSSVEHLIRERLGLAKFAGDIKPQWGNLFEDVLKRFVENSLGCIIRGEDLYVIGKPGTSYSPDGLAAVNRSIVLEKVSKNLKQSRNVGFSDDAPDIPKTYPAKEIALMEFKCPYNRIPSGDVPKYYVPQVLMGLDLLQLPTFGIFVEAVIRRCTWEQLGYNKLYDTTLVPRSSGDLPLSYGIIGFYIDRTVLQTTKVNTAKLFTEYKDHFVEYGDITTDYMCNDLGEAPPALFTLIMSAMDQRLISIKYFGLYEGGGNETSLDNDLAEHTQYCRNSNHINIGILPFKIFRADFHIIDKIPGYLSQWYPTICEIVNIISICKELPPQEQDKIIAEYCGSTTPLTKSYHSKSQPVGFSDD